MFEKLTEIGSNLLDAGKEHSPEILLGVGIVGVVVAGVSACKATLKAPEIMKEHRQNVQDIKDCKEIADANNGVIETSIEKEDGNLERKKTEYTEKDYKRDMFIVYRKTAGSFFKLYWKQLLLGAVSIGSIFTSNRILRDRCAKLSAACVSLTAAYNSLNTIFKRYRQGVIDKYGEEEDIRLRTGAEEPTKAEKKAGKSLKDSVTVKDSNQAKDLYMYVFDRNNPAWEESYDYNYQHLLSMQKYHNDIFHADGSLTLNKVLKDLGFPVTKEGLVVGWVDGNGTEGLKCVDYRIREYHTQDETEKEYTSNCPRLVLDFNVDGLIYDKYLSKKEIEALNCNCNAFKFA